MVLLCDTFIALQSVNEARPTKNGGLENISPMWDGLVQHIRRVAYQRGVWTTPSRGTSLLSNTGCGPDIGGFLHLKFPAYLQSLRAISTCHLFRIMMSFPLVEAAQKYVSPH